MNEARARWSLAVELTSWCNQRCDHCYNAWDPGDTRALPRAELLRLLERAIDELELDHLTLTGGEPLGHPAVFEAMALCQKRGVACHLISNGSLIGQLEAERLAAFGVKAVQITLNAADAERHDRAVGARGHWQAALRAMDLLRRHSVPTVGCVVITRINAPSLGQILDCFVAHEVRTVALSRFSPSGVATRKTSELLCTRSELLVALAQAEQRALEHGMILQTATPIPPCVVDYAAFPHLKFGHCSIGTPVQEFALGSDGGLRQCPLSTGVIGDAKTTPFAVLVRSRSVQDYPRLVPAFCAPCPFAPTCQGGCGAAALATSGGARALDPLVAQHVGASLAAPVGAPHDPSPPREGV